MKKSFLLACSVSLFANNISINNGWNLIGGFSSEDINISKYKVIWSYQNHLWSNSIKNELNISKSSGVWVLNTKEKNSITTSKSTFDSLKLNSGWNLIGGVDKRFNLYNNDIAAIFEYTDNNWILNPDIKSFDENKGYWFFSYTPTQLELNSLVKSNSLDNNFSFSDEDFNELNETSKLKVLDKLYSTLFLGFKKSDIENLLNNKHAITDIKNSLTVSKIEDLGKTEDKMKELNFYGSDIVTQKALARLYFMPISKEYLNLWVAYNLVNSKFFSASTELNTVDNSTGVNLFQKIFTDIQLDKSIPEILFSYLNSEEHWRRFRSPEDNTREVLEIQLEVFNDSLVPIASIVCKNYKYNENEKNLVIDFNYNYEPQNILDKNISTCEDFYSLVSNHKKVKDVFIDYFLDFYFPTYTQNKKDDLKKVILSSDTRTYKNILMQIIFSDEYLLNSIKPKSIEELYLSNAKKLEFYPAVNSFKIFSDTAKDANQPIMYYKLGRELTPPTDILSSSVITKVFRNNIMIDIKNNMFNEWDSGWSYDFTKKLNWDTKDTFLTDIFKYMLQRDIQDNEKQVFLELFKDYKTTKPSHQSIMLKLVLDYISQTPEIYVMKNIGEK